MIGDNDFQSALKDEDAAHPIATEWRPSLKEIADALARENYALRGLTADVSPVSAQLANRMKSNVEAYGETLDDLPEETWKTSQALWMGEHWDVLLDLWTRESGPSDLVLHARVFETESGFRIEVTSVHVP